MAKKFNSRTRSSYQPNYLAEGRKAFNKGLYGLAVVQWERIKPAERKPNLQAAIQEAYFRHAVQSGSAEIWQKVAEMQKDERTTYYYARFLHQMGQVDQALPLYESLLGHKQFGERVVPLMIVALLEKGEEVEMSAVWGTLSPRWQQLVGQVAQFRRRPYQLVLDKDNAVWRALIAYDQQSEETAALLEELSRSKQKWEKIVGRYLAGYTAVAQEKWGEAITHWQVAWEEKFHAHQFAEQFAQAHYRLALTLWDAGKKSDAHKQMARTYELDGGDKGIQEFLGQVAEELGMSAVQRQAWAEAKSFFETANDANPSMRTAYNLALVYEQLEMFSEAGQAWRNVLRRRPRKAGSDNFLTEAQIGRLWQRAAENYTKAEEYDEATAVYKSAVKFDPDNLNLRHQLAGSLFENGRAQAASNELRRILEQHPKHVPTLIKLGEVEYASRPWWGQHGAIEAWKQALEIEPHNLQALANLKEHYEDVLERRYFRLQTQGLLDEMLHYFPHELPFLVEQAALYFKQGVGTEGVTKAKEVLAKIKQTNPDNPHAHLNIVNLLLHFDHVADAKAHVQEMETNFRHLLTPLMYVDIGRVFLVHDHDEQANWYFRHAIKLSTPANPVRYPIGMVFLKYKKEFAIAQQYVEDAIQHGESLGEAYVLNGLLYANQNKMREARKQWALARRELVKEKNEPALRHLEMIMSMIDMPNGPRMLLAMAMGELPPFNPFALFDDDEEDYDDDDDWF